MDTHLVFITCPSAENAAELAKTVITARLAACGNIIPALRSIYRWNGVICDESEALLVLKTSAAQLSALENKVLSIHPYETAEFVAVQADHVANKYRQWLEESVGEPLP